MKYHLQKDEKRGNAKGNTACSASGSRAGWNAIALPRSEFDALHDDSKCARCKAKAAA